MKLKKREITLNEADSLFDMFLLEKEIERGYAQGTEIALRKETANEAQGFYQEVKTDAESLCGLFEKSKKENL